MTHPSVRIHASAEVSPLAEISQGSSIWNNAQIREYAKVGSQSIIGKDVYIDFGVQIGDRVKIQNGAYIFHGTTVESGVFIGPGAIFTNDKRPRAINPDGTLKTNDDWEEGPIRVCYGASIGAGAVILPNVTIGQFALVGAGAVVTRDVAEHALVTGNPARQIGFVCKCAARLVKVNSYSYICPNCESQFILDGSVFVGEHL